MNTLVNETNPLIDSQAYYSGEFRSVTLKQLANEGGRITRVRWLCERGLADLSYVHGMINGERVRVDAPGIFCIPMRTRKIELINWAKEERVYTKGLGLLDDGNWSSLSA